VIRLRAECVSIAGEWYGSVGSCVYPDDGFLLIQIPEVSVVVNCVRMSTLCCYCRCRKLSLLPTMMQLICFP